MSGAISLEISKIDEYTVYVEKALGNYTLYFSDVNIQIDSSLIY